MRKEKIIKLITIIQLTRTLSCVKGLEWQTALLDEIDYTEGTVRLGHYTYPMLDCSFSYH